MSDIYRCENCKFCVAMPANSTDQKEFGNHACRRYPPTPYVTETPDGAAFKSHLVPVNHNWWCGEWRKK